MAFTTKLSVPHIMLISCTEWQAAPLKKKAFANCMFKYYIQNYTNAREWIKVILESSLPVILPSKHISFHLQKHIWMNTFIHI